MIRFPVRSLAFLLSLGAAACSPTEPLVDVSLPKGIWAGSIGATATASGIEVANSTDSPEPFYLFAIERGTAAYTDWIPCTGGPTCPTVMPGERRTLPWPTIPGYAESKHEYIVYSWQVARSADGSAVATHMGNGVVTR